MMRWPRSSVGGAGRVLAASCATPKRAVNQNVEPTPSSLDTPTSPPISSTKRLTMDRPKPVPPNRRVVEESTCVKAVNRASTRLAGIPMPVSRISQRIGDAAIVFLRNLALDRHFAFLRKFDSVAAEVQQDLAQAARIAAHQVRKARIDQGDDLEALGMRLNRQQSGDVFDRIAHIHVEDFQIELAGFDLGEIQNVIDDRQAAPAALSRTVSA